MATTLKYTGDGAQTDFTVAFAYLKESYVKVYVDGVLQTDPADYAFFNATTIRFVSAPFLAPEADAASL